LDGLTEFFVSQVPQNVFGLDNPPQVGVLGIFPSKVT